MSPEEQARLILDAIALLHQRGYGRLKISGYTKGGLGAWRHTLFAADDFPARPAKEISIPKVSGSVPDGPVARGETAAEIADAIATRHVRVLEAAKESDDRYVAWFAALLRDHPHRVLEMEHPDRAMMGGVPVATPYVEW